MSRPVPGSLFLFREAFLYLLWVASVYSFFDRGLIENLLHNVDVQ